MKMQKELMAWEKWKILHLTQNYFNNSTLKAELFLQTKKKKSYKRPSAILLKTELQMLQKKYKGS